MISGFLMTTATASPLSDFSRKVLQLQVITLAWMSVEAIVSLGTAWTQPQDHSGAGLNDINGNNCDVVLLGHGSRSPVANRCEQLVQQLGRRARLIFANDLFKLVIAKKLAAGILGFNHTVGVKQEAVPWADRDLANGVVGIWHDSENNTVTFDPLQNTSAQTNKQRMSRG